MYHPYLGYHYEGFIPYGKLPLVDNKAGMQERTPQKERTPKIPKIIQKAMEAKTQTVVSEDTLSSQQQTGRPHTASSVGTSNSSQYVAYNARPSSSIFRLKNETTVQKLGKISQNYLYVPPQESRALKHAFQQKQNEENRSKTKNDNENNQPKVNYESIYMTSFHSSDEKDKKKHDTKKEFLEESNFSQVLLFFIFLRFLTSFLCF